MEFKWYAIKLAKTMAFTLAACQIRGAVVCVQVHQACTTGWEVIKY